jgi:nucleoside-triphosphatase THEP1
LQSRQRVGRQCVESEQLGRLGQEEPAETDVYLIDEVGKAGPFCPAFVEAVCRTPDDAVPVVLTVAHQGRGLITQIKARAGVRLVTATDENRAGRLRRVGTPSARAPQAGDGCLPAARR